MRPAVIVSASMSTATFCPYRLVTERSRYSSVTRLPPLEETQEQVDDQRHGHEDDPERHPEGELPLARFEGDGGRHRARVPADVPAEHHRHADLGYDPLEAGDHGGE